MVFNAQSLQTFVKFVGNSVNVSSYIDLVQGYFIAAPVLLTLAVGWALKARLVTCHVIDME